MQVLCDTNILSELARPVPDPSVLHWSQSLQTMTISVITVEEIAYGLAARPNPRLQAWFDQFFAQYCLILPITKDIAQLAGNLRGQLQTQGKPRTQADMLIAATARFHDLPLATRNVRDFTDCGLELINPFTQA